MEAALVRVQLHVEIVVLKRAEPVVLLVLDVVVVVVVAVAHAALDVAVVPQAAQLHVVEVVLAHVVAIVQEDAKAHVPQVVELVVL